VVVACAWPGCSNYHFFVAKAHRLSSRTTRLSGHPCLSGIIFAIAWSPTIGYSGNFNILVWQRECCDIAARVYLLLAYSLGLGVPLYLLGLGLNQGQPRTKMVGGLSPRQNRSHATGILMIVVGVLIFFNLLLYLSMYFNVGINI